ncbi:MAG: sulfatase [Verrucomicrobiota bacterium]
MLKRVCCFWLFFALAASAKPPNVVFFLVDDLGWTDLSCTGSSFYETPHIDRLRAEGMKFSAAYTSSGVCSPTRSSIITGQTPARNGCTNYGGRVRGTETGWPAVLRDAGYRTLFTGKWHIGGMTSEEAGFGVSKPFPTRGPAEDPKNTRAITRATVDFIKASDGRPFVAYVNYHAVHLRLAERADIVDKYRKKLAARPKPEGPAFAPEHNRQNKLIQDDPNYAAMMEVLDDSVRDILATVRSIGAEQNTMVIFYSDNGGLSTKPCTSNLPLRAGKGWYYEGGIRVPLIVKWPGRVKAGSTCDVPVIAMDFFPTLLEAAGLPLRPKDHVDGISLAGLLQEGAAPERDTFYWHYPHHHGAGCTPCGMVRKGDYKLIRYYKDERIELYHLKDDLSEKNNLAKQMPEKREALLALLGAWQKSMPGFTFGRDSKPPGQNKKKKKRLRK